MPLDVVELREFYATPLGRTVSRTVRRRLRELWPDLKGYDVLGLGFATPFLAPFRNEAERLVCFMPSGQGVVHWPSGDPNLACLVDDMQLPLPDASFDRIVLHHAIENTENLGPLMQELWRVLAGGGRIIIVAPHRHGVWARTDRTPFGHGRPYSKSQLMQLLRDNQFTMERCEQSLFFPPFAWRFMARSARAIESAGRRVWPHYGGVLIAEATKQLYAIRPVKESVRLLQPRPVLRPVSARNSL